MKVVAASGGEMTLPVMALGPMLRQAVRDKAYQRTAVGVVVGRYLSSMRWQGSTQNTLDTYEQVLAWLALAHADFESLASFATPMGPEYLEQFLQRNWGDAADATKTQRTAIVRSFFRWAAESGRIEFDPAANLKAPRSKRRGKERRAFKRDTLLQLVSAQDTLRDQCALQLLTRMALRKNELRVLRIRDIDLARNLVVVHSKGGNVDVLPIGFRSLVDDLYLHVAGEGREPGEYLLYPHSQRFQPMEASTLHRWFKRCLARAELSPTIEMHELRHSAADELWRVTGNLVLAQQLLRHVSVGTTQLYLHPSRDDLEAGMREVEQAWRS